MSEAPSSAGEALFRANKRRKIYRKRNVVDDETDEGSPRNEESNGLDSESQQQTANVRRPAAKKYGIGFSTAGSKTIPEEMPPTTTAMVPFQPEQDEGQAANDRFVKPAGKTAVVEDKHLTAYVDSKLAELRSSTSTPNANQLETGIGSPASQIDSQGMTVEGEESSASTTATKQQQSQQRKNQRVRPTKRRGPPQRDAQDIARDAMVDQIMRESQVPIYDQPSSKDQEMQATGFDADEAAAEAFRAEFLLSLEERQNRRRPAAPPVQQRGAPPVPTGPKLGGSRAQREKMKAIEEAKAGGKSVDAAPKRR